MLQKTLLLTAILALAAVAAPISCTTVSNVTTLSPSGCSVTGSPLVFSDFSVSASSGFTAATIGIGSAQVTGGATYLNFQLGGILGPGSPGMGDIMLQYRVRGSLDGVDLMLQATPMFQSGNVTMTEVVCSTAFVGLLCPGTTDANLLLTSFGNSVTAQQFFHRDENVWIRQDIQFNGATVSDFTGSYHPAPEPVTVGMVGLGLLALLAMKWNPRKG